MPPESDFTIIPVERDDPHPEEEAGDQPRAVVFYDSDPHPDDEGPDMNEVW